MKYNNSIDNHIKYFPFIILALTSIILFSCGKITKDPKDKKRTLRVWHTETSHKTKQVLENISNSFMEINPEIKVEIDGIAWSELLTRLNKSIEAGNPPHLTHIQPYMGYSYFKEGLLVPINDVIDELIENEKLNPLAKSLLEFDENQYGIAHAMTTSLIIYRKDIFSKYGIAVPETWDELTNTLNKLKNKDFNGDGIVDYGIDLPGKEPFFMDELFGMLVASNGGSLFDRDGIIDLTNTRVVEAATYLKELSKYSLPGWKVHGYLDTFTSLARGDCAMIYLGFARQIGFIEKYANAIEATPNHFSVMPPPFGKSGTVGTAVLDAENWVIFKKKNKDHSATVNDTKKFLKFMYNRKNHLNYCLSVPIHLGPVLGSVANSEEYLSNPTINKWHSWYDQINLHYNDRTAFPILMSSFNDRFIPYISEFQGERILSDMLIDILVNDISVDIASDKAQERVKLFLDRRGIE